MKKITRIILNAIITAGIVFLSSLSIAYPPSAENLYAAFIGASLAFLTQLRQLFKDSNNPPLGCLI